jgi:hypothetical protein
MEYREGLLFETWGAMAHIAAARAGLKTSDVELLELYSEAEQALVSVILRLARSEPSVVRLRIVQ